MQLGLRDKMRNLINLFEDDNEIKEICKKYKLDFNKVTQNSDGTIDYDGNVSLNGLGLTKISLRFNHVTGYFYCDNNPELKSLIGSPKIVDGDFDCSNNSDLESLIGGPKIVGGDYSCFRCKNLKSLKGVTRFIGGDFNFGDLPNLSPSEMRHILFSKIGGKIQTGNKKADAIFKKYHGKPAMIGRAVGELGAIS